MNRDLTAPKAGGLPLHHSPTAARASRYYDATVPAPTVVILAAGEGTRMRSSLPKVLHPLCGRPLIAWPIAAAREAGAGKVVVVDGPKRRLADHLPEGVAVAVQAEPKGTGDAVAAAAGEISDGRHRRGRDGRRPAGRRRDADRARRGPRGVAAPRATMLTAELEDPTGYGRVVRDAEGQVERVVETKAAGDATRGRARDPRGQHRASSPSTAARCSPRWSSSSPTTPRASSTCPTCCRGCARPAATIAAHVATRLRP